MTRYPLIAPRPPRLSEHVPALERVEQSGIFSNNGPEVRGFEADVTARLFGGTGASLAVANATLGLMVAIRQAAAPRLAPGALALMPALTFAATAQAAQWAGLTPLIADIDPETWSIDPEAEERLLREHGDRIAVLVPYATFGNAIDLDRYARLQRQFGVGVVIAHANDAGKLAFWPKAEARDILWFIGAAATLSLGSIPQQDTFQRVLSAKDERTAVRGALLGGTLYFAFALVPLYLAYSAVLIDPAMTERLMAEDSQMILPTLVTEYMPLPAQIFFFGALLSAIMSSASAALLAPAVSITENVIRPFRPAMNDRTQLRTTRLAVVGFAVVVLVLALKSNASIFEMVEQAYSVTLVAAFAPLVCGLYWRRAHRAGAILAAVSGVSVWLTLELVAPQGLWPPQLAGLLVSFIGMVAGSLLVGTARAVPSRTVEP